MNIKVIAKNIFIPGKRVIQRYVFVFASYCILASIFISAYVHLLQFPFKTVCTGYNVNDDNSD